MQHRRWVLVAAAVALVVTSVTYFAVRDGGDDRALTATDTSTSTTRRATSTTRPSTTSTGVDDGTTTSPSEPASGAAAPAGTAAPAPKKPAPTTTRAPSPPPPTTAPAPPYQASIETVTAEELGASWKPGMGCPAPEQLRAVNLTHWNYDGGVSWGRLIVEAPHAERMVDVFRDIYAARFPIQRMVPIAAYGGDDQASMRANNTSGFNCRYVSGTTKLSQHGLGRAVDVNPLVNPYVKGSTVDPPEGAPYADRTKSHKGMIRAGDAVVTAFAARGWGWGGYWSSGKDYQHFSASGT